MRARDSGNLGFDPLVKVCKKSPVLSAAEEQRLAREASAGSGAGFERLLSAHLRLVLAIAHEFRKYGLPIDELVSEGLLGLVEAARRFDPDKGVRLAAYAAWWIRAYVRQYTLTNRRIVRMPSSRNGRRLLATRRRTQHELTQAPQCRSCRIASAEFCASVIWPRPLPLLPRSDATWAFPWNAYDRSMATRSRKSATRFRHRLPRDRGRDARMMNQAGADDRRQEE